MGHASKRVDLAAKDRSPLRAAIAKQVLDTRLSTEVFAVHTLRLIRKDAGKGRCIDRNLLTVQM